MQKNRQTGKTRLLTVLLVALVLCSLLAMPALAEEGEPVPTGSSSSIEDSQDSHLPSEADETLGQEEGTREDSSLPPEMTEPPQEAPRARAAALPTAFVSDATGFENALDDIIASPEKEGEIQLLNSVTLNGTMEIPDGVEVSITGLTGNERLHVDTPASGKRHFLVKGELSLADLIVDGEDTGGGIRVEGGTLNLQSGGYIYNCVFVSTTAMTFTRYESNGGGVQMLRGGTMHMYDGAYVLSNLLYHESSNSQAADLGGGGIAVQENSTLYMHGGIIRGNQATGSSGVQAQGGGIFLARGNLVMTGGEIFKNNAYYGGGVSGSMLGTTTIELRSGSIYDNYGIQSGGGLHLDANNSVEIYNGFTFAENRSNFQGGAIYTQNSASITIYGGLFTHNRTINTTTNQQNLFGGGAIYQLTNQGVLNIYGGTFAYNTTNYYGGAIRTRSALDGSMSISGANFIGNRAGLDGGAIHSGIRTFTVDNSYFADNYAGNGGHYFWPTDHVNYTEISTLHDTRIINLRGLSAPFDHTLPNSTRLNRAYNNFDIAFTDSDLIDYHLVSFYVDGDLWMVRPVLKAVSPSPPGTVADPTPLYTAGTLDGWYTDAGQVGTPTYLYDFSTPITSDLQLYAEVTGPPPVTNLVTFYRNHDAADDTVHHSQTVPENTLVPPPPNLPLKPGHIFDRWTVDADPASAEWDLGSNLMPGIPLALYAQYTIQQYTVTFDYSQVSAGLHQEDFEFDSYLSDPGHTFAGYTFVGWRYGGGYWDFAQDKMPAGPITLVGVWTKNAPGGSSSTTPPVTPPESSTSGGGTNPPSSTSRPVVSSSAVAPSTPASTSPASSSGPSSSAVSEPVASPGPDDELDNRNIGGTNLPLDWWQRGDGWSLLNLLVSILLLLSAAFQLVRMALAKNQREDEYGNESLRKQRRLWTILSAVTGVVPILLLFLLEDFSGAMLLLDKWSPWFIGFALLHAAFTLVALTRKARWKQTE